MQPSIRNGQLPPQIADEAHEFLWGAPAAGQDVGEGGAAGRQVCRLREHAEQAAHEEARHPVRAVPGL